MRETTRKRYIKIIDEACEIIREGRTAVYAYRKVGDKWGLSEFTVRDICNKPLE